jgi:hypothetical protein
LTCPLISGITNKSGRQGAYNTETALTQATEVTMAQATNLSTTSRFHNLSAEALADELGHADALLKGAEAECKALKDEYKRRGLVEVAGNEFTITATEQIAGRLDVKAVKEYLGESYRRFEVAAISTVTRIKAVQRFAHAA